jgi:hypothetical protein
MFCVKSSSLGGVSVKGSCPSFSTAEPEVFGPATWFVLHSFAQNFPEQPDKSRRQACTNFVASLPYMLPDSRSASNFQRFLQEYNLLEVCNSAPALREFFCTSHNSVNVRQGKALFDCSPKNLDAMYGSAPQCV